MTVERPGREPTGPQQTGEPFTRARKPEKKLDPEEKPNSQTAMLSAQKNETKAADDDEEPEFEVLTSLEEAIPRPEVLGEGHGNQFYGRDCKEQAAEPGTQLSAVRERESTRPHRDR